ncbi:hypothetical protein R1sor_017741 [Riccia sorocarpa]|uniref:CCHC-type domain-containing protein n=1 Tax=Riccia sorocarpa TaxID=122646 RepID=A0ABD3IB03_9MARC
MGTLDHLAAQIAKNAEESKRLHELLAAHKMIPQGSSQPTSVTNANPSSSKDFNDPMLQNQRSTQPIPVTNAAFLKTPVTTTAGETSRDEKLKGPMIHTTSKDLNRNTRTPATQQHQNVGHQMIRRTAAEQRARTTEMAKQARQRRELAWQNATNSIECVTKNLERFNKVSNTLEDPYPELENNLDNSHMDKEVLEMFRTLREANPPVKDFAFVLYTVDITPTVETIKNWAKMIPHQQLHFNVTRVRALNRHCFLIAVGSEFDRDSILAATPLYLGANHMIFALPWVSTFNPADITSSKVPIWVELPHVHPGVEAFGQALLEQIGNMPNACFMCHQRGHIIRNCPMKRGRNQHNHQNDREGNEEPPLNAGQQRRQKQQTDADGFTFVGKNSVRNQPQQPIRSKNVYEVLHIEDDEDEQETQATMQKLAEEASPTNPPPISPKKNGRDPSNAGHQVMENTAQHKAQEDMEMEAADSCNDKRKRDGDGSPQIIPVPREVQNSNKANGKPGSKVTNHGRNPPLHISTVKS